MAGVIEAARVLGARLLDQHGDNIALVLIEPMLGFAGAIPAEVEFLKALREKTKQYGILLAFDEVITGFRLAMGGGQELFNITPDLTVLGKAIGGGMPLAAFGGRADVMEYLSVEPVIWFSASIRTSASILRKG